GAARVRSRCPSRVDTARQLAPGAVGSAAAGRGRAGRGAVLARESRCGPVCLVAKSGAYKLFETAPVSRVASGDGRCFFLPVAVSIDKELPCEQQPLPHLPAPNHEEICGNHAGHWRDFSESESGGYPRTEHIHHTGHL